MNFKGRVSQVCLRWILGCFLLGWSNFSYSQSEPAAASPSLVQSEGYRDLSQMFDSLFLWVFTKETYAYQGLLSEEAFVKMTRLSDSLSPPIVVHGQYMQYQWRVFKGIEKVKKKAKKLGLRQAKVQSLWTKRIAYNSEGVYKMTRLEVPISYNKQRYLLRFEGLFWNGNWYHVGAVGLITD